MSARSPNAAASAASAERASPGAPARFRSIFVRVLVVVVGAGIAGIVLSTAVAATLVYDDKRAVVVEGAVARTEAARDELDQLLAIARAELRAVAIASSTGAIEEVPRLVSGDVLAVRCQRGDVELIEAATDRDSRSTLAAAPIDGPAIERIAPDRLLLRIEAHRVRAIALLDVTRVLDAPSGWRIEILDEASAADEGVEATAGAVVARYVSEGATETLRASVRSGDAPPIVVVAPLAPARRAATRLTRRVLAFSALVLVPVLFLAWLLARAVTRPVTSLARAVRAAGAARVSIPPLGGDEIGDLGRAIETMSRHLNEDAEGLRATVELARRVGRMLDAKEIHAALGETLRAVYPSAAWHVLRPGEIAQAAIPDHVKDEILRGLPDAGTADTTTRRREEESRPMPVMTRVDVGDASVVVVDLVTSPASSAIVVGVGVDRTSDARIAQLICGVASSALRHAELTVSATNNEKLAALGRLAAGVTHEINNALALVSTNVQMLEAELAGELREIATDARAGTERVARITSDLSSLSKGGSRVEVAPVDLRRVVDRAVKAARARSPGATIEVRPFAPTTVLCDAGRAEQALLNLIANGADAATAAARPTVTVSVRLEGAYAHVEVRDRGAGILPEVRSRMFEPFHTSKGAHGTGLGLFISRTFARAQGGDIDVVDSGPDGTTFAMSIPLSGARTSSDRPVA